MANGRSGEDFLVLSRVRTGLKREFEFALKVQSEISGLGRTRSRRPHNLVEETPENLRKKRAKSSGSKGKKVGKENEKNKQVEKSVRVVEDSVDLMSEGEAKSDVLDVDEPKGQTEMPVCESKMGESGTGEYGIVETMCVDEISKEEEGNVHAVDFEEKDGNRVRNSKMGLELYEDDGEKASVMDSEKVESEGMLEKNDESANELAGSQQDLRDLQQEAMEGERASDPEKESLVDGLLISGEDKHKHDLETKNRHHKEELDHAGSGQNVQVLVDGSSTAKTVNMVLEKKPLRRFTRSLLKQMEDTEKKTALGDMEESVVKNEADVQQEEDQKVVEKESEP